MKLGMIMSKKVLKEVMEYYNFDDSYVFLFACRDNASFRKDGKIITVRY